MTDNPKQCMDLLLNWCGEDQLHLSGIIDISNKTISRIVNGKNKPKVETLALICFGLHLPPIISEKLFDVFGCKLMPSNIEHQFIKETLQVMYMEHIEDIIEHLKEYDIKLQKK